MALSFNGSTSELLGDWSPGQSYGFTVSCWFRLTHNTSNQALVWLGDKDSANMDHLVFAPQASTGGGVRARSVNSFPAEFAETANSWSVGVWHHVCAIFAAANSRLIVLDGDLANQGVNSGTEAVSNIDRICIGRNGGSAGGLPASGEIAEVAVWSTPLANDEIVALSQGYSPLAVRRRSLLVYQDAIRRANRPGVGPALAGTAITPTPHPRIFAPRVDSAFRRDKPGGSFGPPYRVAAAGMHIQRGPRAVHAPAPQAGGFFYPGAVAGQIIPHNTSLNQESHT